MQAMMAAANVGNGMKVGANSPVIIQSDNTFSQDADNSNTATNEEPAARGLLRPLRSPSVEPP